MMADALPRVAGKLTHNAPLAPLVWFKAGGAAEWLLEPKDVADLQGFLRDLEPDVPVMALGSASALLPPCPCTSAQHRCYGWLLSNQDWWQKFQGQSHQ